MYGNAWAWETLDSPAEVPELDEELPTTSEQALHGVDEGPRLCGYDAAGGEWTESRPDPRGELGTWIVLREHLNESRATAAAEGWGYDYVSVFGDGNGRTGVVWTHRWDSPADAEEFAAANRVPGPAPRGDRRVPLPPRMHGREHDGRRRRAAGLRRRGDRRGRWGSVAVAVEE